MDNQDFTHHISSQYNAELLELRHKLLTMGGLVEQQLADAVQTLSDGDLSRGEAVVSSDQRVNQLELAVDEECTRILVRRQPAASDLRFILAVIKAASDIERIGDEAKRVSRMAMHLWSGEPARRHHPEIEHLGQHVRGVLRDALNAFARLDVEGALAVWREDPKIDAEYEALLRTLMTYMMEDPRAIPWVLDMLWAARSLERVGDRARNLCEYVIYLVHGRDVRHTSLATFDSLAPRRAR